MVTITNANLRANVYETIYDLINAITFTLSSGNSVRVTASFIDDDQTFPQIVINPTNLDSDNPSFSRTSKMRTIRVLLQIYTTKNKDIDQITDKLMDTLEGTKISGLQLVNTDENNAVVTPNTRKIHSKDIALTYTRYS